MQNVALWCSKNTGRFILKSCPEEINVKYIIVDDGEKGTGTEAGRIPVISISELVEIWNSGEIDSILLYTYTRYTLSGIIKKLQTSGIDHIGVFRHRVGIGQALDWTDIFYIDDLNKPFLPYLQINIVDGCNLNCKGCAHFANLFEISERTSLSEFKRDLQIVSENVCLFELRLMGGEPLLCNDLMDYIEVARRLFPNTDLRLVTNGILLLKQESDFFENIKKNRVTLDISGYKPILPYKEKIIKLLADHNIPHVMTLNIGKFYKTINHIGDSDRQKAYARCQQSYCTHLRNGKIYICPMEALFYRYLDHFGIEDFELNVSEFGIDIRDKNMDWDSVFDRVTESVPLCRYCSEDGDELFDWGVSDDPKKEDWITERHTKEGVK